MARVASFHSFAFKRPARPSLRQIGIPDGRDVLAVYLWWAKQQRMRARLMPASVASSVRSVFGTDEEREPFSPTAQTAVQTAVQIAVDRRRTALDLCGVGGQFD